MDQKSLIDTYTNDVCLAGKRHLTCRYLAVNADGWVCAKLIPKLAQTLNARVIAGTAVARGDNCEGRSLNALGC